MFGRSSPYYLPHNLYYDLRRETFSPSLFQLFALSRISGYRLRDWLWVFGFEIERIPQLQIQFAPRRTVLLDSSLDDPDELIPWLRSVYRATPAVGVMPLSHLLEWIEPRPIGSVSKQSSRESLYARIGQEDALAFPELLPGSIVRIRPGETEDLLSRVSGERSKNFVLIEHSKGLCCCRLRTAGNARIALVSTQLPCAEIEFQVPKEARLVGTVDLEIRSLLRLEQPSLANDLAKGWAPAVFSPEPSQLGPLLRWARLRAGLSFRAASATSREIADQLWDERYFIAPGSLSDYETVNTPPRHFPKVVSFCVAYSLRLTTILVSLGPQDRRSGIRRDAGWAGGPPAPCRDWRGWLGRR